MHRQRLRPDRQGPPAPARRIPEHQRRERSDVVERHHRQRRVAQRRRPHQPVAPVRQPSRIRPEEALEILDVRQRHQHAGMFEVPRVAVEARHPAAHVIVGPAPVDVRRHRRLRVEVRARQTPVRQPAHRVQRRPHEVLHPRLARRLQPRHTLTIFPLHAHAGEEVGVTKHPVRPRQRRLPRARIIARPLDELDPPRRQRLERARLLAAAIARHDPHALPRVGEEVLDDRATHGARGSDDRDDPIRHAAYLRWTPTVVRGPATHNGPPRSALLRGRSNQPAPASQPWRSKCSRTMSRNTCTLRAGLTPPRRTTRILAAASASSGSTATSSPRRSGSSA